MSGARSFRKIRGSLIKWVMRPLEEGRPSNIWSGKGVSRVRCKTWIEGWVASDVLMKEPFAPESQRTRRLRKVECFSLKVGMVIVINEMAWSDSSENEICFWSFDVFVGENETCFWSFGIFVVMTGSFEDKELEALDNRGILIADNRGEVMGVCPLETSPIAVGLNLSPSLDRYRRHVLHLRNTYRVCWLVGVLFLRWITDQCDGTQN